MPNAEDIKWFKQNFHDKMEAAVQGTPFSIDLITAFACQETGPIWTTLRKLPFGVERVLELCVGDTLDDTKGRKAFPKNKAELLSKARGDEMFAIARKALEDMAQHIPGFKGAVANPDKFCHGFGVFQCDIQFFLEDPDYFLERRYSAFDASLGKCIDELKRAVVKLGFKDRTSLTDFEMASIAIAYNTGRFNPAKGLKQGFFNGTKFYGEAMFDFIRLAHTVPSPSGSTTMPTPSPGTAAIRPPSPAPSSGPQYQVDVHEQPLLLRKEPKRDPNNPTANVIARLPDGQLVRATTNTIVNGFLEVVTNLLGANLKGFASAQFLKLVPPAPQGDTPISDEPAAGPGVIEVHMPRKSDAPTKRAAAAGPLSLNEAKQPGRKGESADELRQELAAIIDWLGVEKPRHVRYQPKKKHTFASVYVHDYCALAGVYLPRVWWTPGAIEALARGANVQPLYGATIDEQNANDLFRWLRDYGMRFGWRQAATLSELQLEVNQGAIGLIAAKSKDDGVSGHIAAVVPETRESFAKRDADGEVIAPLQSQAGAKNFRYGLGKRNWWMDEAFADAAFWLHP